MAMMVIFSLTGILPGQEKVIFTGDLYYQSAVLLNSDAGEDIATAFVSTPFWEILPLLEGGFIGLKLEPGEHEIELRFTAPYSMEGKWLSCCGIIILIILIVWDLYDKKKQKVR